ncbi:ABC transporter permease [Microbacterium candidum]|uniref:ABC transporter permease n=1 Tax=Microbacterium candidum TaxID=3041922 RepID=A0ABT7N2C5_9MICO|nr:ABC transporter permease [Microbacterium sp. ASV49]MDL9980842.1 ABC transporter permease [Microbacterium sp. ASV49]
MTDSSLPSLVDAVADEKPVSQGKLVFRRFLGAKSGIIALVVLVLVLILSVSSIGIGSVHGWWIWNYYDIPRSGIVNDGAPTLQWWPFKLGIHPFGQDRIGRDYFAMTMRGIQNSFIAMILITGIALIAGIIVGALAGYYRGWVDSVLMRITDVFIVIPAIVIASVVGNWAGAIGVWILGIMLGFFSWMVIARLVRGEFLSLREREFVEAARVAGASDARIIFKHILPNAAGVIIVAGSLLAAGAILLEAAISLLGYGIRSPDVSLGLLIGANQSAFTVRPWLFWWPALFIVTLALSANVAGDALRQAFDPRSKRFNRRRVKDVPVSAEVQAELAQDAEAAAHPELPLTMYTADRPVEDRGRDQQDPRRGDDLHGGDQL